MKKLKIDIDDIALAMEATDEFEESIWCLDTETREVINILRSVMVDIEEGNDEAIDDYPDWMKEMAEQARALLDDDRGRFVEIPKVLSHEAYGFMESFIDNIKDERIRLKLFKAIQGKGAFGRFKNTVSEWPELEKQWYVYRDNRIQREILDWLESIGIEPEINLENTQI